MLYDSYHKKISKVADFLRKVFKHIVLISVVTALLLTMIIAFMATKGIVFDDKNISNEFEMTYGDNLPMKARALFAKVSYEYSSDGVAWSTEAPTVPGDYYVRAVAKNIFGGSRYGSSYIFTLMPKQIDVFVSDERVIYGELPKVVAEELSFEDELAYEKVIYTDRLASSTTVTPDVETLKILNDEGEDVTSSYELNVRTTDIAILPRSLEVTVSDKELIYNDTKFSYDGYEISNGTLADGDVLRAVFDKYLIDVGEVVNTPTLTVFTSDGLDISAHYEISTQIGILKVDYRPLIIQTGSSEKVYDDIELKNTDYEVKGDYGLVEGHTIVCKSSPSIIDVDEVENFIDFDIVNAEGESKLSNYSMFYEIGMLRITPRPVTINSETKSWMYDNTEHYTPVNLEGFCPNHKIRLDVPSIIDVGEKENRIEVLEILDENGRSVFDNYEITYGEVGIISITKRPITITQESTPEGGIVYDGEEKIFSNYLITSEIGLAEGDSLQMEFLSFSQAGEYDNKLQSATVFSTRTVDGGLVTVENDVFKNYEITEIAGKIVINKCFIEITPILKAENKIYDATSTVEFDYVISQGDLPNDHVLDAVFKAIGADVGEYTIELDNELTKVTFNGADATANFKISAQEVSFNILQRPITVVAESASKPYDGTPLSINGCTVEGDGLIDGHKLVNFACDGSQTEIGSSPNVLDEDSFEIRDADNNDVTKNYKIDYKKGTLEVVKRKLSLTSNSESKIFDGEYLTGKEATVDAISSSNDGLLDGHTVRYTLSGSILYVGKVYNEITSVEILDSNREDVSKYYDVIRNRGVLEILPIQLTFTSGSETKVYDGKPLTNSEIEISGNLFNGHKYSCTLPASITDVGEEINRIENIVITNSDNEDVTKKCYEITTQFGTLKVTPIKVNITTPSDSKVYDGTLLTNNSVETNIEKLLVDGHTYTIEVIGEILNAGSVQNEVEFNVFDANGNSMVERGNYEAILNLGMLTVTPRTVRIEPLPQKTQKVYDGIALTCENYRIYDPQNSDEGLLNGVTVKSITFNSLTYVGIQKIAILQISLNNDIKENYNFVVEGNKQYKITKRSITILSTTAEKEYDGRPLTAPECYIADYSSYNLADGDRLELVAEGSQTEVGISDNIILKEPVIWNNTGSDVTDCYDIECEEGTLTVYKTKVATVTSNKGGYLYFKNEVYGDYTGSGFNAEPSVTYVLKYNSKSYNYALWMSATLGYNSYEENTLRVSLVDRNECSILPYYVALDRYGFDYPSISNEKYISSSNEYTAIYHDYCFETQGLNGITTLPHSITNLRYNSWVNENYLTIDSSLENQLLELVSANGFSNMSTEQKIKEVARYIRTSARYNLQYDEALDSEEDIVIAFLTEYREGSSKHYATAATMLYRALGIPARYVEGYIVESEANVAVDVDTKHSWVEVFISDYGWVQVEVTTGFGGMSDDKIDITLKPKDVTAIYDGKEHYATEIVPVIDEKFPTELLEVIEFYTFRGVLKDIRLTDVGHTDSFIDESQGIIIYDENGNDITYKFNIKYENGDINVKPMPINIYLYSKSKEYDGKPLQYGADGEKFYAIRNSEFKEAGYTLDLQFNISNVNVFSLKASELSVEFSKYIAYNISKDGVVMDNNNFEIVLVDVFGNKIYADVDFGTGDSEKESDASNSGSQTEIVQGEDYVVASILKRKIELTSASETRYYEEDEVLTNSNVYITKGSLADGNTLVAMATGRIEAPGIQTNTLELETVRILLSVDGNAETVIDVTENYDISIIEGTLTYLQQ